MIDYDAAVLRRAITADAADRVTRRHYLAWHTAQIAGARFLEGLDAQVRSAGYTPAEARRIVDDALELENRRRARRRPTSTTPTPSRPRILTVVP